MSAGAVSVQSSSSPGAGPSSHSTEHQPRTFKQRFRSSLEQTLRNATGTSRTKSKSQETTKDASMGDISTIRPVVAAQGRVLRHKPSVSDPTAMLNGANNVTGTGARRENSPTRDKGKHRATVDFIVDDGRNSKQPTVGMGLRNLERVGLRRLASRERTRPSLEGADTGDTAAGSTSKLPQGEDSRTQDGRDRDKLGGEGKKGGGTPVTTGSGQPQAPKIKTKSSWTSFLVPSLSQATLSTPVLASIPQGTRSPPLQAETGERKMSLENSERLEGTSRKHTVTTEQLSRNARKDSARVPASRQAEEHVRSRDRDTSLNRSVTPPSPSPPPRLTKPKFTSPSSPSLVPSQSLADNQSRNRPRPSPLQFTQPNVRNDDPFTQTTPHSQSFPIPSTPTRSATASPTTPLSSSTTSPARAVSPSPKKNRSGGGPITESRPPLSPSAIASRSARIQLRLAGTGSTTHLPLSSSYESSSGLKASSPSQSSSSAGGNPHTPERSDKRRPSASSSSPTTASGTSGRVTPNGRVTPTTPTSPSYAAPTSVSRARAISPSDKGKDRERYERSQSPLYQSQRSKAASSTTSLKLSSSPTQSRFNYGRGAASPIPGQGDLPPAFRDTLRHAASLLVRELNGPRPRASAFVNPNKKDAPVSSQSFTPEIWDECELRLRKLARAERLWPRMGGPYTGSSVSLNNPSSSSVNNINASTSGSTRGEQERQDFADAIKDGYVLCQLFNKLQPGSIPHVDPHENGRNRMSNATRFFAAVTRLGLPDSEMIHRDDLLESNPEALYRIARTIIAIVIKVGEDAVAADRAAGKYLYGQAAQKQTHPNSPYGTRSKAASSSTPNLSTLQRSMSPAPIVKKRWSPPSPSLPTVRSNSPAEDNTKASAASSKEPRENTNITTTRVGVGATVAVLPAYKSEASASAANLNGSALVTDSEDSDANDEFFDMDASPVTPTTPAGKNPQDNSSKKVVSTSPFSSGNGGRVSMASGLTQTTNTTVASSLLAPGLSSGASADRASTAFGTIRTVTTVATSALSEEPSLHPSDSASASFHTSDAVFRSESGRIFPSALGPSLLKMTAPRDRRPSETAANDLSRVIEESDDGIAPSSSKVDTTKRPQAIQLGKGKWPDDFVNAFQPPPASRAIAIKRPEENKIFTSNPFSSSPLSASPSRKLFSLGESPRDGSNDSLPQLIPRRPLHRPRHSIDAPPALLPKDSVSGRDGSPGPESNPAHPRLILRRSSTSAANRYGVYIPRSSSASPAPQDMTARVPFPRSVSGDNSSTSPVDPSLIESPSHFITRGRFQSEVNVGTNRKPRPNSFDELGVKPNRSRIESMASLGGASSNFSASDLRNSMDGSAVRKTLIIREDGRPGTHYQLGNCIGRGQFGSVYRALNLNTGQMVAVKRIRLDGLSEDEIKQLMREVDVVKSLSHPSIIKYEGMMKDHDTLNIVLELAENGSLGQTLKAFGKLNERLVASYVVKILEGLDYLHRNDVVHCDLKAANILTTKTGNIKLTDFGVSLNLRKVGREVKNEVQGTPNWMAPEVIELKGASRASDIWSLGCTVIELLTGRPPYSDIPNSMSVMYHIVEDEMPPIPEEFPESLKDFLRMCFQKEPSDRPSAELLCEHEWLKAYWGKHKELRPQDSMPFLRRVSTDLQKSEALRILSSLDLPRSDSQASNRPRRSEERSVSPGFQGLPGSPSKRDLSNSPATPRKRDSEISLPRDHSFIKASYGKPVLCRVCMQYVRKNAMTCEECSLIAHARCVPTAPPTCGLRAQLLQYAHYSENSPSALELLQQLAPSASSSPALDSAPPSHSPSPDVEDVPSSPPAHPPTAFKMFSGFRRSRSRASLSPDPNLSVSRATSQNSHASSSEPSGSGLSGNGGVPAKMNASGSSATATAGGRVKGASGAIQVTGGLLGLDRVRRAARPLSMSSDGTNPNNSSLRSAATAGGESEDLSVSSQSQSRRRGHGTIYGAAGGASALSGAGGDLNSIGGDASFVDTSFGGGGAADTDAATQYSRRFSMSVSVADSADPRRASMLAASTIGANDDDDHDHEGDDIDDGRLDERLRGALFETHSSRHTKRRDSKSSKSSSNTGCVMQ